MCPLAHIGQALCPARDISKTGEISQGWLNQNLKTKKVIAYAKRVWDRYVACYESPYLHTVKV